VAAGVVGLLLPPKIIVPAAKPLIVGGVTIRDEIILTEHEPEWSLRGSSISMLEEFIRESGQPILTSPRQLINAARRQNYLLRYVRPAAV
jgi:hypothetical protein